MQMQPSDKYTLEWKKKAEEGPKRSNSPAGQREKDSDAESETGSDKKKEEGRR